MPVFEERGKIFLFFAISCMVKGIRNLTRPLDERGNLTCVGELNIIVNERVNCPRITDPFSRCYIFFHTCIEPASEWE